MASFCSHCTDLEHGLRLACSLPSVLQPRIKRRLGPSTRKCKTRSPPKRKKGSSSKTDPQLDSREYASSYNIRISDFRNRRFRSLRLCNQRPVPNCVLGAAQRGAFCFFLSFVIWPSVIALFFVALCGTQRFRFSAGSGGALEFEVCGLIWAASRKKKKIQSHSIPSHLSKSSLL